MKKMTVLFIVFFSVWGSLHAQTWDEWFRQKKTQITYLTQQVAALQVYEGYLTDGYQIARKGLTGISTIKNGEFGLHQTFFSSLSKVSASVQKDDRISGIISLQSEINAEYTSCYTRNLHSEYLSTNELTYIRSVFDGVLNGCANNITDLISVTTNDQLQLSDDERLQRINTIYIDMQGKFQFAQSFAGQTSKLILSRQREQHEISSVKSLYNLK